MAASVWRKNLFPFMFRFTLLVLGAIIADGLLHFFKLGQVGRWLGILAVVLLVLSFVYSLRKRKWIKQGSPKEMLRLHEQLAWAGAWVGMVHSGVHFHAVVPWGAAVFMIVCVFSGMIGQRILKESRARLKERQQSLEEQNPEDESQVDKLWSDQILVDGMKNWRKVHGPLTAIFGLFLIAHVAAILRYWA